MRISYGSTVPSLEEIDQGRWDIMQAIQAVLDESQWRFDSNWPELIHVVSCDRKTYCIGWIYITLSNKDPESIIVTWRGAGMRGHIPTHNGPFHLADPNCFAKLIETLEQTLRAIKYMDNVDVKVRELERSFAISTKVT